MVDHLSFSGASLWEQCPAQWYSSYVEGIKSPPTVATEVGTLVHGTLEGVFRESPAERTQECARRHARAVWDAWEASGGLKLIDGDGPTMRRTVWDRLGVANRLESWTDASVVGVEMDLSCDLNGVPFVGYADRVSREPHGLVIVDYKTGSAPQQRYRAPKLRQIVLYAAAAGQILGETPTEGRLMFLGGRPEIVPVKIDSRSIYDVLAWFKGIWREIQSALEVGRFPTQPGPLCGWCPVVVDCLDGMRAVSERHAQGKNVGPASL